MTKEKGNELTLEVLRDPSVQKLLDTYGALTGESERASPLVASEWISDMLARVLRATFSANNVDESDQNRLLKGYNAPLGSFAVRISICRAFGIINDAESEALHALREIRNHCAHSQSIVALHDASVQKWVRAIKEFCGRRKKVQGDPKSDIVYVWARMSIELNDRIKKITRKTQRSRPTNRRRPAPQGTVALKAKRPRK